MQSTKNRGFTLIELMLSMSFIGILLIVMTFAIIHITNMYGKGLAIKAVNQAGRDVGAALRRDGINVSLINNPIVQPTDAGAGSLGRLCLGSYSYVWSPPAKLLDNSAVKYADAAAMPIVFARTSDPGGELCKAVDGTYPIAVNQSDSTEMLPTQQGDYAIHMMTLERNPPIGETVTQNALYIIKYTIGTNDNGSIDTADQSCKVETEASNNFNYCSINTFELVIRAG